MTMKKQIIYMVCATALLSSCHIYKAYDRPDTIETSGIYRDPVSATDTLTATDTANMGNLPWKEVFRDPKLQALIEEGLANNVDMQAAILRVEEAKLLLTSARLSFLPSLNLAPQGTITKMENTGYVKAYTLPAAASWEVDLFGKLLNASRGQKAAYLQSQYTQQAIRSQLIGGIANAYFTLLMLDRQGGDYFQDGRYLQRKCAGYGGDEGCRHDNRSRSRPDACRVPSGIRFVDRTEASGA